MRSTISCARRPRVTKLGNAICRASKAGRAIAAPTFLLVACVLLFSRNLQQKGANRSSFFMTNFRLKLPRPT